MRSPRNLCKARERKAVKYREASLQRGEKAEVRQQLAPCLVSDIQNFIQPVLQGQLALSNM
jgi:hypothetical protein